jgi:hypothetical protein
MTTHTRRNSEPSLWEQAIQLWRDLVLGYGRSIDMMRWGWMRALEHRGAMHWVRDLEELVRRAIRADAEDCDLPPLRPRAPCRPGRRRQEGRKQEGCDRRPASPGDMPGFDARDETTWQVSFRMIKPAPRPRGKYKRSPYAERRPCIPLARRIEALRRVIHFPRDYVRRYARRLARIEQARLRALAEYIAQHAASAPVLNTPPRQVTAGAGAPTPPSAKHVEPG